MEVGKANKKERAKQTNTPEKKIFACDGVLAFDLERDNIGNTSYKGGYALSRYIVSVEVEVTCGVRCFPTGKVL